MQFHFFPPRYNDDTQRLLSSAWQNRPNNYQLRDENVSSGWKHDEWVRVFDIPSATPAEIFQQARARIISMDIIPPRLMELTAQWNVEDRLPQVGDLLFQRTHLLGMRGWHVADILSATRMGDVIDEPERYELQYIAVKGHPEKGASRYIVANDGQQVRFTIKPVSKPANILTQLANPIITRRVQVHVTNSILDYVVTAVTLDLTGA